MLATRNGQGKLKYLCVFRIFLWLTSKPAVVNAVVSRVMPRSSPSCPLVP